MLNTSDGNSDFTLDIAGTLNVLGETSGKGVYYDFKNNHIAGIMMGHWAGSSRIRVRPDGQLLASKSLLLINYDAKGEQLLAINGGYVRVKGVTNDSLNLRRAARSRHLACQHRRQHRLDADCPRRRLDYRRGGLDLSVAAHRRS